MDEDKQSLTSLFRRLCELSFLQEAELREDAYTKIRYTASRRRKLQTRLYEKLFDELQAPWVGEKTNNTREKLDHKTSLNVYEKLAVKIFQLRLCRQFDKADWLDHNCLKWKSLPGSLKNTFDPSQPVQNITELVAIVRFILALSGTGPQQSPPLLGYQNECYPAMLQDKKFKRVLPEGPLLSTDSYKLRHEAILADQYILYTSDVFERPPTIDDTPYSTQGCPLFHNIMAPGQGRNRFFAIQEFGEVLHDKKTRLTVFGALSHGYTSDMQVKLGIPDLPSSNERALNVASLPSLESPEDEGFHEISDLSNGTSKRSSQYSSSAASTDIWTEALKLPPQKYYVWEMEGRRDGATDCPYITEAGPIVFDELYNLLSRQVSYLVKSPTLYNMVSLRTLVDHSLIVLIGVPTTTFPIRKSLDFHVAPDIRLSGCSPDALHNTLSKLAAIGSDYLHLVEFMHQNNPTGGLVLHAFIGGLRNYLQCYRATVLTIDSSSVQSPFQLTFTFHSLGKQLRFLSDMCMCSMDLKNPPSNSHSAFPVGVKLLSYLYKLCLEHSSTEHYPVLLSLLKHSCAPYIMFIQQWVFQGICRDVYEEFIIEVDDQFLAYRDKHFWSHGFVISEKDKLDCVPMFLSELANDIFVCGKSINLMKLCCPGHFLCDSGVPPPTLEVTFSMNKLKTIDLDCLDYVHAMEALRKDIKDKREKEQLALAEAKGKALMEERAQAEKALDEITGLIQQVKEAIDAKKKADLKMLKEQMEEAIEKRKLEKERETEVDNKYMVDALNRAAAEEDLRERARQELLDYYEKLTEEMDRREERVQWKIQRLKLNEARIQFLAEERAKLQRLTTEKSEALEKENELQWLVEKGLKPSDQASVSSSESLVPLGSSQTQEHQSRSVSSPSLVSLIASGVKTDALVKLDANKPLNFSNISDSGFIPGTEGLDGFPGKSTKDDEDDHTLHSVLSLAHDEHDGDETDISVASDALVSAGRKKWSSSKNTKPEDLKSEPSSTSSRRKWDPAADDVNLAESPLPQSHPSDSSIQFSMYGDKMLNTPKANEIKDASSSNPSQSSVTPNPSDSSIEGILYPSTKQRDSFGVVTKNEAEAYGTTTQEKVQLKTQGIGESTRPTEETEETASKNTKPLDDETMDSEEQPKEDAAIQDFLRSLSKGVDEIKSPSLGHPSDSSIRSYITEGHTTRSPYGYPNQSTAQTILYPTQYPPMDLQGQTKSPFGHPNDSTVQNMLYVSQETPRAQETSQPHPVPIDVTLTPSGRRSPYGHPSDSDLSSSVSRQNILAHKARSHWGHPSDSKVQKLLGDISILSESQRTGAVGLIQEQVPSGNTRGTPPVDSAKDIIYPVEGGVSPGGKVKSTRGHEPAVMITKLMYPVEQKEVTPESIKPLEFEDVWVASEVEPLQMNFNVLDEQPTRDLLKSALSAVTMDTADDDDDIEAAQLMTLPVLLRRCVTAPLMAQISLVNKTVVEYFMEDLKLPRHFEVFRKFLFMEDGEFSLSLSDQLFEKLTAGMSPFELCSPTVMNGIVTRALQLSVYADKNGFEQQLSFALKTLPDLFHLNDIGTLDFLELRYRVDWPLNIVITENSIIKYNKVFSFMLRLKRVAWVLREVWFHLKHVGVSYRAAGSPQLRQLQLFRHEMLHFLQNIDGYLSNQILNVTWVEFQQELATNVRDLDDLHHRHTEYLNKAVFRSLLSKKASPVMKIITDMFSLVLKFRTQLLSCPWQQDSDGGHVTHPRFDVMSSTHKAFKEYSGFLFTVLSKLVRRGYQSHLQDFLLRLNFNGFYKT